MKSIFFGLLLLTAQSYSQADPSLATINLELAANANSILVDELIEVDVTNINKVTQTTHRVVAVLNKKGESNTQFYAQYDDNSRVKHLEMKIFDANGKKLEHFKKKHFHDVSNTGDNNLYADDRVLYINYTPTTYPYFVVFDCETETGDSAFLNSWIPLKDYGQSTQSSVMKVRFNPSNKPRYRGRNLEGFNISIAEDAETLTFSAKDIAAVQEEELSPGWINILPHVFVELDNFRLKGTVGSAADWQQLGQWVDKSLLAGINQLPEGTLGRIKRLVASDTTNEAKARKIYQFVQDKVRYISIQIGIGGWKPMPASQVDKLSYGDCKALTYYTKTLLEAVGVPAYYTLIYAGKNKIPLEDDFAQLNFNHAILGIPDDEDLTWLECTSQDHPFGYLGSFTHDRDALMITPKGGKIVHSQVYQANENIQTNSAKAIMDAGGNVNATFTGVSQGLQYEDKFLLPKKKNEEIDAFYKQRWSYLNGLGLRDFGFNNDRENIKFTENVTLEIPMYANAIGNEFLLCPNIFNQQRQIPPKFQDRKQKLYLNYGYVDVDSVEVEIPENFSFEALPEPTVLETKFGRYEINFELTSENNLRYTRRLEINQGEYPASEYDNYRDFKRTVARLDRAKVLVKPNMQ